MKEQEELFIVSPIARNEEILKKLDKSIQMPIYANRTNELDIIIKWRKSIQEMVNQVKSNNPSSLNDLKMKKRKMSIFEDMRRVNPYFRDDRSFTINCAYCAAVYDLRRRGYDVEADDYHFESLRQDERNNSIYEIYSWWTHFNAKNRTRILSDTLDKQRKFDILYPGYKYFNTSEFTADEIERIMLAQGSGARGIFIVDWSFGGAHAVAYEIRNDYVLLIDSQVAKTYSLFDLVSRSKKLFYFRTDNEAPTDRILLCLKNKKVDSHISSRDFLINEFRKLGYKVFVFYDKIRVLLDPQGGKYFLIFYDGFVKYVDEVTKAEINMKENRNG